MSDMTPSPVEIRREFEDLIAKDLRGPAGGPTETLPGRRRVRDRYLVGMLAPKGTVAETPETDTSADVSGARQADTEGMADQGASTVTSYFPSSFGLTFVVAANTHLVRVKVEWGQYRKATEWTEADRDPVDFQPSPAEAEESADTDAPKPEAVWVRHPIHATFDLDLAQADTDGILPGHMPVASHPGVVVRGRVRAMDHARLVTLFLVNEQEEPHRNRDEAWLYQAKLAVESPDGAAIFIGRDEALNRVGPDPAEEVEIRTLDMLYRHHIAFAVGHGTSVHAVASGTDSAHATRVETATLPTYEVPATEAPGPEDDALPQSVRDVLSTALLDMKVLAAMPDPGIREAVEPLVAAYELWLDAEEQRVGDASARLGPFGAEAASSLADARHCAKRLRAGIDILVSDPDAAEAFRFANHVMWQQRIRTLAIAARRGGEQPLDEVLAEIDADPKNHAWRPFQLAFLLLNLPALTQPTHWERSADPAEALVDLLFFPTGGGKTEAYLGLTAYTLAIRRLQGMVGDYDGRAGGVAVLMRYTLRLLTAQQFQRAAALICACEVARRERFVADERWGDTPFRLGMWVGSSVTPNRFEDASDKIEEARAPRGRSGRSTPLQLISCPWCGHELELATSVRSDADRRRIIQFCPDPLGTCAFSEALSPMEGLPVVTVDEEMYRLLPALVISTADKFAQLPWQGPLHLLFGKVRRRCTRHGYRSPDLDTLGGFKEADKHYATKELPAASTVDVMPLRPPDLIIQDELHLITGPLGTMVGLYETAIDRLATWEVGDQRVRPKVVASTATIRRAAEQAHALFWRRLAVFPPPVLDVANSFFAVQRPTTGESATPGRRYLGVCAHGRRLKEAEVRVFTTVLAAAQTVFDKYGLAADPWMTCVGYFSALRELGGAKRLIDDEVANRLRLTPRRGLAARRRPVIRELTSRMPSSDIPATLDDLTIRHDPVLYAKAEKEKDHSYFPIDVLLATNMISVGVDVPRLGLMFVLGQPKATAEYIQATSRVGRSMAGPGLVVTLYNWARPRDLSHYETFEHYHATFYRHVEALSVTPFSPRALDRGLAAVLVALVRHAGLEWAWNPNPGARAVSTHDGRLDDLIAEVARRAEDVSGMNHLAAEVTAALQARLDVWAKTQAQKKAGGTALAYTDDKSAAGAAVGLLRPPDLAAWDPFTCPHSLRETEPNVQLLLDMLDPTADDLRPYPAAQSPAEGDGKRPVSAEDAELDTNAGSEEGIG